MTSIAGITLSPLMDSTGQMDVGLSPRTYHSAHHARVPSRARFVTESRSLLLIVEARAEALSRVREDVRQIPGSPAEVASDERNVR